MLKRIKQTLFGEQFFAQIRLPLIAVLLIASIASTAFLQLSVNTVRIFDGEEIYTVRTLVGGIADAIDSVKLKSNNYKILSTNTQGRVTDVSLAYVFPVYITVGDSTVEFLTEKGTVQEILANAGYNIDEYDMVEPSRDTLITKTAYIDYTDISYEKGSYTQAIPCTVESVYSDKLEAGKTQVLSNGTDGLQNVEYTTKFVNGVAAETTVDSVTTVTNAVNGKTMVGTKKTPTAVTTSAKVGGVSTLSPSSPIELDANGSPIKYKSVMTVQATAYTYTGHRCATGVTPQPGYIAVNPKVIPYGTKLYIKSADGRFVYGYAIAADTGGFIKSHPTNVDLFFATKAACSQFGRQNVQIFILE